MQTNTNIKLRPLGKTDIRVTPIGLGAMELSGGGSFLGMVFPVIPPEQKNAIIKAALDGGINWFDTAEMYGGGVSEQSVASGLKAAGKSDKDVVIATKWFPLFRTAGNIARTIDRRLHYLGGFSIGNYMVHNPMGFSSPEAEMNAMADLVEAGKIRSVGVSNFNPARMERAFRTLEKRGLPLAVNQMHYSLLHRDIETDGVLKMAKDLGVTIIAYTPLASGLLSGKYHQHPELLEHAGYRKARLKRDLERTRPLIDAMGGMAEHHEATIAQVALNWVINFNGDIVVTIPGATKAQPGSGECRSNEIQVVRGRIGTLDELSRRVA